MSDTRLNTSVRGECRDLLDVFLYNQNTQYNCYFNSKGNCRGVGILVSTRLNISICNTFKDEDDNILGLLCNLDGSMILLVAIYGPNKNCNSYSFFNSLSKCLVDLPHVGCVLGGDWNATYSSEDCVNNIDIHNMVAPPSIVRSRLLGDLCAQHNLSDPYRALYPERRDFTFQPRTRQNNRSRLDFFLISDCMLGSVNECTIPAEISTILFDHKSVTLRFGKSNVKPNSRINNSIFSHPRVLDLVAAVTMDTYLHHTTVDNEAVDNMRTQVGNLFILLKEINDCELDAALNGKTHLTELTLAGLLTRLEEGRNRYILQENLNELTLSCEDDVFFEVLIGNLKNSLISFQSIIKKIDNIKVDHITSRICRLRDDFLANHQEIAELEGELNNIVEDNIKKKVLSMKLFEGLHSEKPSPLFLALSKKRNVGKLANIKKNDGSDFASDAERRTFITSFYENLYKKPVSNNAKISIEEFLGENICNSFIVNNSKLTQVESEALESPLTVEELDKSINDANMRSAPGIDGFSNSLIKKIWPYIRTPLHRYALCCYAKGVLTQNFRCASVRLIPKKGNADRLNNWRPISLL